MRRVLAKGYHGADLRADLMACAVVGVVALVAWNMSEDRHFAHLLRVAPKSDVFVRVTYKARLGATHPELRMADSLEEAIEVARELAASVETRGSKAPAAVT